MPLLSLCIKMASTCKEIDAKNTAPERTIYWIIKDLIRVRVSTAAKRL